VSKSRQVNDGEYGRHIYTYHPQS